MIIIGRDMIRIEVNHHLKHKLVKIISAFVKRWHHDIKNFHFFDGEMTITLDDVLELLHLIIVG